jgi:hypothetical protein
MLADPPTVSAVSTDPSSTAAAAPTRPTRSPRRGGRRFRAPYTVVVPEDSVLAHPLPAETRPYSPLELASLRARFAADLGLSNGLIFHTRCGHAYYVKVNGAKHKELLARETDYGEDLGNCSVCWKLKNTPRRLRNAAQELVNAYLASSPCQHPPARRTFDGVQTENAFNVWLNLENFT